MPRPNGGHQKRSSSGKTKSRSSNNNTSKNRAPPFESSFLSAHSSCGSFSGARRVVSASSEHASLQRPLVNGGKNGNGMEKGVGGVTYRSADSTQRTLNELARRRHERMERRRAATLLAALAALALGVHLAARNPQLEFSSIRGGGDDRDRDGEDNVVSPTLDGLNGTTTPAESGERNIPDQKRSYLEPLQYFQDVVDPVRTTDVPFFFHIPRNGGQTVKDIVGQCLGKVLASEVGIRDGHDQDLELSVVNIEGGRYVNVDTTSTEGIARASELGLGASGLADMVSSSYLRESGSLFDLDHQGRAFTIIRNPLERAVSMYYFRTKGPYADLAPDLTLEAFAQGNGIENNWMTRFLIGKMEGELSKGDLGRAKEVLETKFLIGLLEDAKESFHRILLYYGWDYSEDETEKMRQEDCVATLLKDGTNLGPEEYMLPKKGTQPYALISWQTQFDMKLYDYAKELFEKQTKQFGSRERKKDLKKKKKKEQGN